MNYYIAFYFYKSSIKPSFFGYGSCSFGSERFPDKDSLEAIIQGESFADEDDIEIQITGLRDITAEEQLIWLGKLC